MITCSDCRQNLIMIEFAEFVILHSGHSLTAVPKASFAPVGSPLDALILGGVISGTTENTGVPGVLAAVTKPTALFR